MRMTPTTASSVQQRDYQVQQSYSPMPREDLLSLHTTYFHFSISVCMFTAICLRLFVYADKTYIPTYVRVNTPTFQLIRKTVVSSATSVHICSKVMILEDYFGTCSEGRDRGQ